MRRCVQRSRKSVLPQGFEQPRDLVAQARRTAGTEVPGYPGLVARDDAMAARLALVLDRARAADRFDAALNGSRPCARDSLVQDLRAEGIVAMSITARRVESDMVTGA